MYYANILLVFKIIRLIYLANFSLHLKVKPDSYLKEFFNIVIYLTFHLTLFQINILDLI